MAARKPKPIDFIYVGSPQVDLRFLSLCLMSLLTGMEMDIFTPSFPELMGAFSITIEQVQLTLSLNFVAYALSTLWIGPLAERFSSRNITLLSLCVFITGSIFCYIAPTFEALLIGRVLQGLGMSGPNVLSYAIVYEHYPNSRESYMGILNGVGAVTMGAAPVLGSYLNLWFGWRASFLTLLILSLICFALSIKYLPKHDRPRKIKASLGLNTYIPLFKSKKFLWPAAVTLSISVCYFVFVGLAPIFYREDLHVSLEHFGMYQGALAASFGVMSFCSGMLYKKFGKEQCFKISIKLYALLGIIAGLYGFILPTNPLVLTLILIGSSMACAMPINITYAIAMGAVDGAAARASGMLVAMRLVFSAAGLQVIAHFYDHTYLPLAVMIGSEAFLAWGIARKIVVRD
jgi:DHA1 family bicyclomycin/chloramphenicol resistance-like MFS transporter